MRRNLIADFIPRTWILKPVQLPNLFPMTKGNTVLQRNRTWTSIQTFTANSSPCQLQPPGTLIRFTFQTNAVQEMVQTKVQQVVRQVIRVIEIQYKYAMPYFYKFINAHIQYHTIPYHPYHAVPCHSMPYHNIFCIVFIHF